MAKCVKLLCTLDGISAELLNKFKHYAQKHNLEGSLQKESDTSLKIIACGDKDAVETFIDLVHKECQAVGLGCCEAEPFLKDRDYRGVFRVIE